ncbi:MAG: hypothetical protein ABIE68_05110 [bacterium]
MLTEVQLQKFQEIYKKKYGIRISKAEAREKGMKLIRLLKIIIKNPK